MTPEPTIHDYLDGATLAAIDADPTDVHTHFGLSYANYLVLPRALLQSMPLDWQHRFVGCLRELDAVATAAGIVEPDGYDVQAVSIEGWEYDEDEGREVPRRVPVADPVPHYNRGRARLDLRPKTVDWAKVRDAAEAVRSVPLKRLDDDAPS